MKKSLLDRLRHSLRQDQQFFLVGLQGVGQAVNQRIGRGVAEIQPLILYTAEVGETDINLRSQITKTPFFCVPKLSNLLSECHHRIVPQWHVPVAGRTQIS